LESLTNAANSNKIAPLTVHECLQNDKRKTVKRYFLNAFGKSVSPELNYENMNHFILGFNNACKILNSQRYN
jgi:hypothetical protein